MTDPDSSRNVDPAMRERLDRLSSELDARRRHSGDSPEAGSGQTDPRVMAMRAMTLGFRAASEIVAAVVVGGVIGWQLDRWLGTRPILLVVFFFMGIAAGFLNLYRTVQRNTPKGPPDGAAS